jgi:hypothetical protein
MDGLARDIEVVQVVVAPGRPVGEGREVRRGAAAGADDGRDAAAGGQRDFAADADRPFVKSGEPAPQRIDEMDLDGLDGRSVEIVLPKVVRIAGEPLGEGAGGRFRYRARRSRCPWRKAAQAERRHAGDDDAAWDRVGHGRG